jgi:hypothetical protein
MMDADEATQRTVEAIYALIKADRVMASRGGSVSDEMEALKQSLSLLADCWKALYVG